MEPRFAFALKANLFKICRLCGIDYPNKVPIIRSHDGINSEELDLSDKIHKFIGILIASDDKMPQEVCTLCVDKINDFYEFREMCLSTNAQTRKLLGLKAESTTKVTKEPKSTKYLKAAKEQKVSKELRISKELKGLKEAKEQVIEVKSETTTKKRVLKRKCKEEGPVDEIAGETADTKNEPVARVNPASHQSKKLRIASVQQKQNLPIIQKKIKLKPKKEVKKEIVETEAVAPAVNTSKFNCAICKEGFGQKSKLEQHQALVHLPQVQRFVCVACDEIIKKANDIKNHQLWHKLSKTPYVCGLCGESSLSVYAYSRHLRDHNDKVPFTFLVLDRQCPQCHKTFVTNFLFNIHSCAVATKKCAGCNRQQRNPQEYLRHAAICDKNYVTHSKHIPVAMDESNIRIKNETNDATSHTVDASLDIPLFEALTHLPLNVASNKKPDKLTDLTVHKKNSKKGASKKNLKRVDELLKSTMNTLVSIKHEPEIHMDIDHENKVFVPEVENAVEDDNAANDDDDNMDLHDSYDQDSDSNVENDMPEASNAVPNTVSKTTDATEKVPVLKLKIKKEHGTLNSSIVDESDKNDKKKKKKKRRDTSKGKSTFTDNLRVDSDESFVNVTDQTPAESAAMSSTYIKQEIVEEVESEITKNSEPMQSTQSLRGATVMTSIPFMQFQISCISSGVAADSFEDDSFSQSTHLEAAEEEDERDIKPTQQELQQMLKIAQVSAGVELTAEEEMPSVNKTTCFGLPARNDDESAQNRNPHSFYLPQIVAVAGGNENDEDIKPNRLELDRVFNINSDAEPEFTVSNATRRTLSKTRKLTIKKRSHSNIDKSRLASKNVNLELPKISAVVSCAEIDFTEPVNIKEEPLDTGYHDVLYAQTENHATSSNCALSNDQCTADNFIDFSKVIIKQEKDVDIPLEYSHFKQMEVEYMEENNEEYSSTGEEDNDDKSEEDLYEQEELEEREYRELELPPQIEENIAENTSLQKSDETRDSMQADTSIVDADTIAQNFIKVRSNLNEKLEKPNDKINIDCDVERENCASDGSAEEVTNEITANECRDEVCDKIENSANGQVIALMTCDKLQTNEKFLVVNNDDESNETCKPTTQQEESKTIAENASTMDKVIVSDKMDVDFDLEESHDVRTIEEVDKEIVGMSKLEKVRMISSEKICNQMDVDVNSQHDQCPHEETTALDESAHSIVITVLSNELNKEKTLGTSQITDMDYIADKSEEHFCLESENTNFIHEELRQNIRKESADEMLSSGNNESQDYNLNTAAATVENTDINRKINEKISTNFVCDQLEANIEQNDCNCIRQESDSFENNSKHDDCLSQNYSAESNAVEATIVGHIVSNNKEQPLEANSSTPTASTSNTSAVEDESNYNNVEEQQNQLNHSLYENSSHAPIDLPTNASTSRDGAEQLNFHKMHCGKSYSKVNFEEYENSLNENADTERHLQQQPQTDTNAAASISHTVGTVNEQHLLINRNLNEIAENNNNANIERELQDENASLER